MRLITLLLVASALPSLAWPDEVPPLASAATTIAEGFYVAPLASYAFTDGGRRTDNAYGGAMALGKQFSPTFSFELSGQYSQFDPARLYGIGVNALFFPSKQSFYAIGGVAYGKVRAHPGNDPDYGTVLVNLGAGWLWKPFNILGKDVFLRTEALYRLDAHNDRRTGDSIGNGRKAFNDAVFNAGLLIPIGSVPAPPEVPPLAAEPVQMVAVEEPPAAAVTAPEQVSVAPVSAPVDAAPPAESAATEQPASPPDETPSAP